MTAAPRLLINADDYAYFPEVSRGILDCAQAGPVRATGILATSPHFDACVPWLREAANLDLGVHLNLSSGRPLTPALAARLAPWNGCFPPKAALLRGLLSGSLPLALLIGELRAQVEHCTGRGLKLWFLNSHEHLHMLPGICPAVLALARELGIGQVRRVRAEWGGAGAAARLRALALWSAELPQRRHFSGREPQFVGLPVSGRLSLDYLRGLLGRLQPGLTYELMCHPGRDPADPAVEPRLRAYHDWDGERRLLLSDEFRELIEVAGVHLVGYRDLVPITAH
jgi:predicted glycoside hydrolase/deacetylase ChbG (UPF0249 family)